MAQAQAEKVIRGAKLRVDSTVVETHIHYPTDSVLLGDSVRVLTRFMRQITKVVGDMGEKMRNRQNGIIVGFEVYDKRPADSKLLIPAIELHQQRLGVVPRVATGDAGFFSAANETAAQKMGVVQVAVPYRGTHSVQRRKRQKERWFRKAQKWRIGCEGRISVLKRRHGLRRCLYKGETGMHRWVGLGVIADNLINIGKVLSARLTPKKSASDAP